MTTPAYVLFSREPVGSESARASAEHLAAQVGPVQLVHEIGNTKIAGDIVDVPVIPSDLRPIDSTLWSEPSPYRIRRN